MVAYSQHTLKEFDKPESRPCDDRFYGDYGAKPENGVIVVYSDVKGLTFDIQDGDDFLITSIPDEKNNSYILIVKPTGNSYHEIRKYNIHVCADGYMPVNFTTGKISAGGRPSSCWVLNPKIPEVKIKPLAHFIPGMAQMQKGRKARGTLIIIGETLTLAAGGVSLYNEIMQKNIMDKPEVSYQDYIAAEKSYEQWNTARHISFITAAVIYSLNLVDAYLTPTKSQNNIVFTPNVMNTNGEMAVGATLSIRF